MLVANETFEVEDVFACEPYQRVGLCIWLGKRNDTNMQI